MPTARENELFSKSENVKKWITYYRRNWDLFAEEVLGIKLYPVQKLKLHMIGVADEYWDFSSRSTAKSFIVGVAALCAMSLYPHSEIVITSASIQQSARLVRDKMIKETGRRYILSYNRSNDIRSVGNVPEGGRKLHESGDFSHYT